MKGKLIIISGFSGVGKGTVINKMMAEHPGFVFSVSATSRYMRPGEEDGVQYFFLTREEFEKRISEDRFLEHAQYNGNYYGTPRDYIEEQRNAGRNVILDIECKGAFQVKEKCADAVMIYMLPPSADVLYRRLKNRGTENDEQIRGRMEQSRREAEIVGRYETILVNEDLDQTVKDLMNVIEDSEIRKAFYDKNIVELQKLEDGLDRILTEI